MENDDANVVILQQKLAKLFIKQLGGVVRNRQEKLAILDPFFSPLLLFHFHEVHLAHGTILTKCFAFFHVLLIWAELI